MAIPPGTYRERLKSTRNTKREHCSGRPTRFHPHRDLWRAERCDRPLSCFNRGIEHVQRQLLNTTCPRSPSHPCCPSFSFSFLLSLCSSFGLSVSPSRSACRSPSLSWSFPWLLILFNLLRPRTPLDRASAARSAWVCDSRSLTRRQRDGPLDRGLQLRLGTRTVSDDVKDVLKGINTSFLHPNTFQSILYMFLDISCNKHLYLECSHTFFGMSVPASRYLYLLNVHFKALFKVSMKKRIVEFRKLEFSLDCTERQSGKNTASYWISFDSKEKI